MITRILIEITKFRDSLKEKMALINKIGLKIKLLILGGIITTLLSVGVTFYVIVPHFAVTHTSRIAVRADQTYFSAEENPKFTISLLKNPGLLGQNKLNVTVKSVTGQDANVDITKLKNSDGTYDVSLQPRGGFRPGEYRMTIKGNQDTLSQDFLWGVLAINTNKSVYTPNEKAYIQMAVLNKYGHTVCNGKVKLEVTDPDGNATDIDIKYSDTCGDDNVTDNPDYYTYYQPKTVGNYILTMTNLDNNFQTSRKFTVEQNPILSVERIGATRTNPFKAESYRMTIIVKARQSFSGTIEEQLPSVFGLVGSDSNTIVWNLTLLAGEEKTLSYEYTSPLVSPQFYLVGPLKIRDENGMVFNGEQTWQIAADAVITSARSGSWSSVTTWVGSSVPLPADSVVIAAHNVTVGAGASAVSVTFSTTAGKVEVRNGFTLAITSGMVLNNAAAAAMNAAVSGPGTINVPTIVVGNTTPSTNSTLRVTALNFQGPTINVDSITVRSGSAVGLNDGRLNIATGTINISNAINTSNQAAGNVAYIMANSGLQNAVVNLSGATPWSLSGTGTNTTTLNGTSAVFNYNSTSAQTILGTTYTTLKINNTNASGASLGDAATTVTLTIGDINSAIFKDAGYQLTATGGTLNLTAGSFILGSVGTATTFPGVATANITNGTTVEYASGQAQTVDNSNAIYSNLVFSGAGVKTTQGGPLALKATNSWIVNSPTALNTNSTLVSASSFEGTGNVTQGILSITISGNWSNSGVFTASSASTAGVTLNKAGSVITGSTGGITFYNLTINDAVTNNNAGTITVSSAFAGTGTWTQGANSTLTLMSTSTITGLDASTNSNTINYSGAVAQTVKQTNYSTLVLGNSGAKSMASVTSAANLTITDTATMTSNSALRVSLDFTYSSSGTTGLSSAQSIIVGRYLQTSGSVNDAKVSITITGTGANAWNQSGGGFLATGTQQFTGISPAIGSGNFMDLTINVSGSASLANTVSVAGNLTISGGTFDLGAYTANRASVGGTLTLANITTLRIGGGETLPSNYSTHSFGTTGTVVYYGTSQAVSALNSSQSYGRLIISGPSATLSSNIGVASQLVVDVGQSLTASTGTTTMHASSLITNNGALTFYGLTIHTSDTVTTSSSFTIKERLTNSGTFTIGGGTITFNGTSYISGSTVSFSSITCAGSILDTQVSINISGTLTVNSSCIYSQAATINNAGAAGTITGAGTITISATSYNVQYKFTNNDLDNMTLDYYSGGSQTINSAPGPYGGLTIRSNGTPTTKTLDGSLTVNGDVIIEVDTTLSGQTSSLSVSGNWVNGGTLYRFGTLILNGLSQTISGSNAFLNLSIPVRSDSAPRTVFFTGGSITAIGTGGSLTLSGSSGKYLSLLSSDGNNWHLHVNTTNTNVSVSNVVVSNSDASGFKQIDARSGSNTNQGGNTNWLFLDAGSSAQVNTGFSGIKFSGIKVN
jgi:hypothetical protein